MIKSVFGYFNIKVVVFLFVCLNILIYLPYFLNEAIVGFSMDTFGYLFVSEQLKLGLLPVQLPYDFPIGYSLFINLFDWGGGLLLILIQLLLYVLSSIFFIKELFKLSKSFGVAGLLGLCMYSLQPYTIRFNLSLNTESLFISFIIIY